jgi:hypothetical protein
LLVDGGHEAATLELRLRVVVSGHLALVPSLLASQHARSSASNRSVFVDPSTVLVSVRSTPSASWTMLDGTVEKRKSMSPAVCSP